MLIPNTNFDIFESKYVKLKDGADDEDGPTYKFDYELIDPDDTPQEIKDEFYSLRDDIINYP